MDGISVTITGQGSIFESLANLQNRLQTGSQAVIEDHTNGLYDDSQAACPVATGTLQASGNADIQPMQGTVEYTASYASYVNSGHHTRSGSYVPPNPFLDAPAFTHALAFVDDMGQVLP